MDKKKYTITKEQKLYFGAVLLLENIANLGFTYPVLLEGDDTLLEPILIYMVSKNWVEITNNQYSITEEGKKVLENYLAKLVEFRSAYKIYNSIDLGEGEFAYSKYFDFETDEQFINYINGDNFEDLRVAICEFKKINPLEVIFMEMVDEGRFDCEDNGWQADLSTGLIWNEMVEIANTNLHLDDLAEGEFTGEEVMELIIEQGSPVMMELLKKQKELDESEEGDEDFEDDEVEEVITTTTYVEEPVFEPDYFEVYYDPYYVSPYWGVYYY